MGSWVNIEVTFPDGVRVFGGSLAHGPTKKFVTFRKSPMTKSQGQYERSKGIRVI